VAWKQGPDEILVRVPITEGIRGKDVQWEVHPARLRLAVKDEVLLEGDFGGHRVELDGKDAKSYGMLQLRCTIASRSVQALQRQQHQGDHRECRSSCRSSRRSSPSVPARQHPACQGRCRGRI